MDLCLAGRRFFSVSKLKTRIGKIEIANPVICSSGCCGHAYELEPYMNLAEVGAFSIKTVTLEPRNLCVCQDFNVFIPDQFI